MIYPDLDNIRRASEQFDKIGDFGGAKKTSGLFTRGPKITRQFLDKLGPDSQTVLGWEFKARQIWYLAGLMILFSAGLTGSIVMWMTGFFDNALYTNLVIANNTEAFEMWTHPPVNGLLHVYLYNYTNVEDYKVRKTDILNVQEVGPYVYEEKLERVNVQFIDDDKVSYQEKRTYKFRSELSHGRRQSDRLTVPNVPLITGAVLNRNAPYFQRLAMDSFMGMVSGQPFLELPAQKFIFGYDDNLYSISKNVMQMAPTEKFGLLAHKLGISPDVITINTGSKDINRVGMVEKLNEETALPHWSTAECNAFKGTDGLTYPPRTIKQKQPIYVFSKQFCRALPMYYDKEVSIIDGTVPAYRYRLHDDIYASPDEVPENQCYCDISSGQCAPKGLFNTSSCNFGAPLFLSLPHFFNAAPEVTEGLSGLKPIAEKHRSYADFHPNMGFAMGGASRFQANIQMIKPFGMDSLSIFQKDEMMLPLTWVEMKVDDKHLPDSFKSIIYKVTFLAKGVELGLKYGCLLTCLVTMLCAFAILRERYQARQRANSVNTPLQRV